MSDASSSRILYGPIVFNDTDANGVRWAIDSDGLDGWGSPASTLQVVQAARRSRGWAGEGFLTPRPIAARGRIVAPTPVLLNEALDLLYDTVSLDERQFTVEEAGFLRSCEVKRTDTVIPTKLNSCIARFSFGVTAEDPRKMGETLTQSTGLPSTSGGLTIPFTVPYTIPAVTESGQVSMTNPGNITGPVTLRIDGPFHGPSVTHDRTGRTLDFSPSLIGTTGEWLDIDMDAQTVLANGQVSRNLYITTRGWSGFEPGDNTWSFTASAYDPATLLTVNAKPSWK